MGTETRLDRPRSSNWVPIGLVPVGLIATLVLLGAPPSTGAFPGSNGKIAFVSDRAGNLDIYTMNSDGGDVVQLTDDPSADRDPAWSPDGTRIAFSSERNGQSEIYVMDATGANVVRLTDNDRVDYGPAWSPDGQQLVFWGDAKRRKHRTDLFIMNADGSERRPLTKSRAYEFDPTWSPDGKRIAFERQGNDDYSIYLIKPNGEGLKRLTMNSQQDQAPDWTPDSKRVVFSRLGDLYSINRNGKHETRLLRDGDAPVWSPDGAKLVFVRFESSAFDIFIVDAEGDDSENLTGSPDSREEAPDWQPLPNSSPPPSPSQG